MQVLYRDNARLNLRHAKAWYKQQREGLQKEFAYSVKEAIVRMLASPEAFAIRYRNVRIVHTNRFPFSIHFYIDHTHKQIVITNILHDSQDFQLD